MSALTSYSEFFKLFPQCELKKYSFFFIVQNGPSSPIFFKFTPNFKHFIRFFYLFKYFIHIFRFLDLYLYQPVGRITFNINFWQNTTCLYLNFDSLILRKQKLIKSLIPQYCGIKNSSNLAFGYPKARTFCPKRHKVFYIDIWSISKLLIIAQGILLLYSLSSLYKPLYQLSASLRIIPYTI